MSDCDCEYYDSDFVPDYEDYENGYRSDISEDLLKLKIKSNK